MSLKAQMIICKILIPFMFLAISSLIIALIDTFDKPVLTVITSLVLIFVSVIGIRQWFRWLDK